MTRPLRDLVERDAEHDAGADLVRAASGTAR